MSSDKHFGIENLTLYIEVHSVISWNFLNEMKKTTTYIFLGSDDKNNRLGVKLRLLVISNIEKSEAKEKTNHERTQTMNLVLERS